MAAISSHPLEEIFHPRSIAVVGASKNEQGTGWVGRLLSFGYKGRIYPVNPNAKKVNGLKAFPNIKNVPEKIDYAILNIPAHLTPQALLDCAAKGVKFVHCFTAGFSETGTSKAKQLEARLAKIAGDRDIRLLGPNCMGIYCPASRMTFDADFPKKTGPVAFVSQSGTEAMRLVFLARDTDVYFSKVISYGNAINLDAPDFLEYLADDKDTKVVACYIEGSRQLARLTAAVKKCLRKKPVIVLKGGLTGNGTGAVAFHTASPVGSKTSWDNFFKQTGAIPANTMGEVADIIQTLLRLNPPKGRRVALVGRGGGIGVIAADICERAGLEIPSFSNATRKRLGQIISEAGVSTRNPVETMAGMNGAADFYLRGLPVVDKDTETDIILVQIAIDIYGGRHTDLTPEVKDAAYALCAVADSLKKPLAVALFTGGHPKATGEALIIRKILTKAGIPVYSGVESASRAIGKVITFYKTGSCN
ncbi:MAG: CoA-binding protein [Dehalococcoidales bacterium]|nr:CoA-binding protein [Dehalococcoidales bacterium]